jgi:hypothetical protein
MGGGEGCGRRSPSNITLERGFEHAPPSWKGHGSIEAVLWSIMQLEVFSRPGTSCRFDPGSDFFFGLMAQGRDLIR